MRFYVASAPLRLPLAGGATDLDSYAASHGGLAITAALRLYVAVVITDIVEPSYVVRYSKHERAESIANIRHPIVASVLRRHPLAPGVEIASTAQAPSGTGLGSSGAFTVALLAAVHYALGNCPSQWDLAREACHIEINDLSRAVGRQDQYASALGGIQELRFGAAGAVEAVPAAVSDGTIAMLEERLVLVYSGRRRSASRALDDQHSRSLAEDASMLRNLDAVKEIAVEMSESLKRGRIDDLPAMFNAHWELKRSRSPGLSSRHIDSIVQLGRDNGADGAKLVGAGGGGFVLFYCSQPARLVYALDHARLRHLRVQFDDVGVRCHNLSELSMRPLSGAD